MSGKWWLSLKAGDQVYVPMERRQESGMAQVYSNGKKYLNISLHGRPMRVRKSDGCVDLYPNYQICRDEKDHMDAVWQRKRARDTVDTLSALLRANEFRFTDEDNSALEAIIKKMTGETE